MSDRDFERLRRILDTFRPGDDPAALAALVPESRRRGDRALALRLAGCFVDPRRTALPSHALETSPSAPALDPAALARMASAVCRVHGEGWRRGITEAYADVQRLYQRAVDLLRRLAEMPETALEDTAVESVAFVLSGGVVSPDADRRHLVDRWVALGDPATALQILVEARRWFTHTRWEAKALLLSLSSGTPEVPGDGLFRLRRHVLAAAGRDREALVRAAAGVGHAEQASAIVAALTPFAAETRATVRRLAALAAEPASQGTRYALGLLPSFMIRDDAELLADVLPHLRARAASITAYLPWIADRMGSAALPALLAYRDGAPHHKWAQATAAAIARIAHPDVIDGAIDDLAAKAASRREGARATLRAHPARAMLGLAEAIGALVADTTRKGRAARKRTIAAADALLGELVHHHPLSAWVLHPFVRPDRGEAFLARIPAEHRHDPTTVEAESPVVAPRAWIDALPWVAGLPKSRVGTADLTLEDRDGPLPRDLLDRLVAALEHPGERGLGPVLDQLDVHVERGERVRFAHALFDRWSKRNRYPYAALWILPLAARCGDLGLAERVRRALGDFGRKSREERLARALVLLGEHVSDDAIAETIGLLSVLTGQTALRRRLERFLETRADANRRNPIASFGVPTLGFGEGATPPLAGPLRMILVDGEVRVLTPAGKVRKSVPKTVDGLDASASKQARAALGRTRRACAAIAELTERQLARWTTRGEAVDAASLRTLFANPIAGPVVRRCRWARHETPQRQGEATLADPRDARDGFWAPAHPSEVSAEAWRAARPPAPAWQDRTDPWRPGDPLPFTGGLRVPQWSLVALAERRGWLRRGMLEELYRIPERIERRLDDERALVLEVAFGDRAQRELIVTVASSPKVLETSPRAALGEAIADLRWLAALPDTGEALAAWREARGHTRASLSKVTGMPDGTLAYLESLETRFEHPSLIHVLSWALTHEAE